MSISSLDTEKEQTWQTDILIFLYIITYLSKRHSGNYQAAFIRNF